MSDHWRNYTDIYIVGSFTNTFREFYDIQGAINDLEIVDLINLETLVSQMNVGAATDGSNDSNSYFLLISAMSNVNSLMKWPNQQWACASTID